MIEGVPPTSLQRWLAAHRRGVYAALGTLLMADVGVVVWRTSARGASAGLVVAGIAFALVYSSITFITVPSMLRYVDRWDRSHPGQAPEDVKQP